VTRRVVQVLASPFEQLDLQLPSERGPEGEPSGAEFAASDLLDIVDAFATLWDELPCGSSGRPDYRDLITDTRLVYAVRVRGQLSPVDGAIELTDIVIDLHAPIPKAWTSPNPDREVSCSHGEAATRTGGPPRDVSGTVDQVWTSCASVCVSGRECAGQGPAAAVVWMLCKTVALTLRWFESITRHHQQTASELRKRGSGAVSVERSGDTVVAWLLLEAIRL
jgi:hypothetical protein